MAQFDHLDEFKTIRDKWVHEDNVINHRITWLILSQAMLMAAYGWSIASPNPKTQKLVILIPIFGILFTLAIGLSVIAAIIAQHSLRQHPGATTWPTPYCVDTFRPVNWIGRAAPIALPFFLFIVWVVVLVA